MAQRQQRRYPVGKVRSPDVQPGCLIGAAKFDYTITVSYRALLNGNPAIPDNSGNIKLSSYLVVYE